MPTEIALRLILDESRCRRGDDDLAAVRECPNARTTVDVDPDIALGGGRGGSRVQAHPDRDRTGRERLLPCDRRG